MISWLRNIIWYHSQYHMQNHIWYHEGETIIWNPVYLAVHTGMYFWKFSHGCTYRYILVQTNGKWPKVCTSTYQYVLLAVQDSTCQCKAVHGSTWQFIIVHFLVRTDSMLVHTGRSEYKLHGWPAGFCAWNFALLKALILQTAHTPMPCTNRFIHSPCQRPWHPLLVVPQLQGVLATSPPQPLPAGRRPSIGPSAGCGRRRQSFVAKRRSMILGWGRLQAQGTLRTTRLPRRIRSESGSTWLVTESSLTRCDAKRFKADNGISATDRAFHLLL